MNNKDKIILDLCGGTGAWSKPYKDAGYDVRLVTLPEYNVRDFYAYTELRHLVEDGKIYGILAAPPCTMFSFARTKAKKKRSLSEAMEIVKSCFEIIWHSQWRLVNDTAKYTKLTFWALENPSRGLLKNFIGKSAFVFNPYEFGDMYKKETALWGNFKEPKKIIEEREGNLYTLTGKALGKLKGMVKFDYLPTKEIHPEKYGELTRTERRAITPAGFAKAFFEANQ